MKKQKLCPLLRAGAWGNSDPYRDPSCECIMDECGWWIDSVYTTEGLPGDGRCAIKFMAEKDKDGKLPV